MASSLPDWALALQLSVFPCIPAGKQPAIRGQDWGAISTFDLAVVKTWADRFPGCNWAVDAGKSGLVVLDADGAEGKATLLKLDLDHGVPETRVHATPRGGLHLLFKGACRSRIRMLSGMDVRSVGGYAVIPPSRSAHGQYKVQSYADIAPCPDWLLTLAGKPLERRERGDPLSDLDDPAAVKEATYWLAAAQVSVSGQGGNDTAYKVACRVRDYGLSEAMALTVMEETWNSRCEPPWSEEELSTIVRNAFAYAQLSSGTLAPEVRAERAREAFKPDGKDDAKHGDVPISVKRMVESVPVRREWIVPNMIPVYSSTLLTGAPGTGKSTLLLQLAMSSATGKWLGHDVRTDMSVLYVGCEDAPDELHRRIHELGKAEEYRGIDWDKWVVRIWSRVGCRNALGIFKEGAGMLAGPFYDGLDKELAKLPKGHRLLLLDGLGDVYQGSISKPEAAHSFVKEILASYTVKHGVSIVVLSHPPKHEGIGGSNSEYSGTTAWEGSFRARLYLKYLNDDRKDDWRLFRSGKQNYSKSEGEQVLMRRPEGVFEVHDRMEVLSDYADILYDAIARAADSNQPFSLTPQNSRYIHRAGVPDAEGKAMSANLLRSTLQHLIERGSVELRQRAGNKVAGLYPKAEPGIERTPF